MNLNPVYPTFIREEGRAQTYYEMLSRIKVLNQFMGIETSFTGFTRAWERMNQLSEMYCNKILFAIGNRDITYPPKKGKNNG